MRVNIYASFNDTATAQNAVGALLDHGIHQEDITLVLPVSPGDTEEGIERAEDTISGAEKGITTTTGADAAVGATKGAFVGFGVGALAVLASILVPGVGLVVGGGALATALAGAAATTVAGSVAGGVTGFLKDQGVPADEITHFTNVYEGGGAILTVTAPSNGHSASAIEAILGKYDSAQVRIWRGDSNLVEGTPIGPDTVMVDPTATTAVVGIPRTTGIAIEPGVVAVDSVAVVDPIGRVTEVPVITNVVTEVPAPVVDIASRVEPAMVVNSANPDEEAIVVEPSR
jgi:hypothetical protein